MKLLNAIKQLAGTVSVAIKTTVAAIRTKISAFWRWLSATATQKAAITKTAVTTWWAAHRTPLTTALVLWGVLFVATLATMGYAFYLERSLPAVAHWIDALFRGQLWLPGWQVTVQRTAGALLDLTAASTATISH